MSRPDHSRLDYRNPNSLWGSVLAETLHRSGLREVVISPGSRSTPLTMAFARHPGIEAIPVLDERSAAFFALGLARFFTRPRQTLLNGPDLREPLLGNGQRLGEHSELAQLLRHNDEVLFVVHEELGHVAVVLVDAALVELPRRAKILPVHLARAALRVRARRWRATR